MNKMSLSMTGAADEHKANSIVTVDLSLLKENVNRLKSLQRRETEIMAVVKADAYGHGAVKVAEALSTIADAFAVNDVREGVELRKSGINKEILVFGVPEPSFAHEYKKYDLTATVSAERHFDILPEGTSYHLNFDTGMGRLGFRTDEAKEISVLAEKNPHLSCEGIYSHFATAHEPDSVMVGKQLREFEQVLEHFPGDITRHICNTGGTAFYDIDRYDMVRLGIGMYGYSPSGKIEGLQPVLRWSSRLVQVNRIEKGKSVSYGATWKAPADGYIGVIPVGYSDGLRRNLSGRFRVRIGNEEYEGAGIVTMNFCMVYLGADFIRPGTEADLIYPGNDAGDWARMLDTISYEVLTGIDRCIPRTYV